MDGRGAHFDHTDSKGNAWTLVWPRGTPLVATRHEAASLLRYHERTIRRLIERGELRAVGQVGCAGLRWRI